MSDDYQPPKIIRGHDSTDCRRTYGSLDGCPSDCDCNCHSDESGVYLADELGMHRD